MGLLTGFGAGYYLGARAGRQRYEQIQRLLKRAKRSDLFEGASEKAKAVVDLGVERAKDLASSRGKQGNGSDGAGGSASTPLVVEVPVPPAPMNAPNPSGGVTPTTPDVSPGQEPSK